MTSSKQKHFCCTHPQPRIDSPEPPPRPLASIDGIFAAAALPEDHPHALQFKDLREKKPELDPSIVRSPGFTDKLKMQWRKKSVKSLSKEKEYDEDAKAITSQEVLVELHAIPGSERSCSSENEAQAELNSKLSDVIDASRHASDGRSRAEIRSSVLGSAEYLRPLIQQPSMIAVSGQSYNIVDVATRVATQRALEDLSRENERPLPPLPKSLSSPMLLPWNVSPTPVRPRRTKSELGLDMVLNLPKQRASVKSDTALSSRIGPENDRQEKQSRTPAVPSLHVQEPTLTEREGAAQCEDTNLHHERSGVTSEEPHLHDMDISHQLRSMSQLSDPVEDDVSLLSSNPWNFHRRERSGIGFESSARSRHSRIKSSTGMDSTTVPSAWGRVRSPTAASSIYSRPTSAGPNAADGNDTEADRPPYSIPMDMDTLFADWPLRPSASSDDSDLDALRQPKPLPSPPFNVRKGPGPGSGSFMIPKGKDEAEVTWLSPPRHTIAAPRTSSSSMISGSSKKSRFLERFSPPKRVVRKRRSIFKFLRPGSRKQQARSISSPILCSKSPSAAYDGPSDDPALLTVQYELVEQPQQATRSASMNQLDPMRHSTSTGQLPASPSLQRQPTLADYERNLSVMGDTRRRPSSMNLMRLNEIQEEDRRESIGIRRKLSRAKELKDDVSPLMMQALTKHQKEKNMFRSSSKRREADGPPRPTPVFSAPRFSTTGSSLAPTPEDQGDLLDPLATGELATASGRENSVAYLSPLDAAGPSRRVSAASGPTSASIAASSTQLRAAQPAVAAPRQPKIGTSLASWSRYPSHTRFERCGSASKVDNVITRDFAFDFDPAGVNASEDSDAGSPGPHPGIKVESKQSKKLQKSRSLTFGSIMRYYGNLFHTSGWAGQNRRTSVTVGGRLEHPELEMLPPQVPTDRLHGDDILKHLKDVVEEDAEKLNEFVQDEERKLGDYVRMEEGKLEEFVHEEEDKLEKLVEEEEGKLEGFVKKEEGKFLRFVHDEEEKWKHHQERNTTPFRQGSIFSTNEHHHPQRKDTMIAPGGDQAEEAPEGPSGLHLDGTANIKSELQASGPSKAQLWSELYQQVIVRPVSKEPLRSESMPPPMAKPRIRRFPSVTVVDDQKGHYRSISLISVKTSRS